MPALRVLLCLFLVLSLSGLAIGQQQFGTITGTVTDEQGGVLPGVTVTIESDALIGGSRTAVTSENGSYVFRTLSPGAYNLSSTLAGFATMTQENIEVAVARTSTLNVEMRVGGVEETITVTGEAPVVDVRTNITSTNIDESLYEAVPTGRNPWEMAALVPGMITGQMDVGGNRGMQQYQLEISGSANSQKSFSIDGLKVNWPGGSGGWTMQYYDFGMFEEYNFQTSAMTAESDVAGVYMNMVTRSGSNDFSGTQSAYWANDSMQGNNVDGDLASRLGIEAGSDTGRSGNPIDISYDIQGMLGGPIARDKAWFFSSVRWWRVDQYLPGTDGLGDDGGPVLDDNTIRNLMGKVTLQPTEKDRIFFMASKNWKYRYHRNRAGQSFAESAATSFQKQPAHNAVFNWNRVMGTQALLDIRVGRMWGISPYFYNEKCNGAIPLHDTGRGQALRCAPNEYFNPNHRNQFNANVSYFVDTPGGGHDFKFGVQIGRERFQTELERNGDMLLRAINGVADEVVLYDTPTTSDQRLNTWGAFVQDAWTVGNRLTLNLGVRFDGINGRVPPQTSPAGSWVGARSYGEIKDVPNWPMNIAPRLGMSYDISGTGRTALKAYYGRTYIQTGSQFTQGVNPVSGSSVAVPWNDIDGDLFLAKGPSGGYSDSPELDLTKLYTVGFSGGLTTTYNPDTTRPYSDLVDIGVEHQISGDVSMSARYIRRHHRGGIARVDNSRPSSAYSPVSHSFDDPIGGARTITVFDLDPAYMVTPQRVIQNVDVLKSEYDGIAIDLRKRMSDNWQMLGGITLNSHQGFDQSDGYYTGIDFNDPNQLINRDDGSVFYDLPWTLTFAGSYLLPGDVMFSGNYRGRAGQPMNRTLSVKGLTQGTRVIRVAQRGEDRAESFTNFINLRLSKRIAVSDTAHIEPVLELFNILNGNTVQQYSDRIGGSFQKPSRILAPRLIRFGLKWVF